MAEPNRDDLVPVYDPRDKDQNADDPSTWRQSTNPALYAARYLSDCGLKVDWGKVAEIANSVE